MADELIENLRNLLEGQIDFEGQRLAEIITYALLTLAGVFAFGLGFFTQNIHYTLWAGLGGTALAFIVVVPPWPFFNKNPVDWLPPRGSIQALNVEVDGKKLA